MKVLSEDDEDTYRVSRDYLMKIKRRKRAVAGALDVLDAKLYAILYNFQSTYPIHELHTLMLQNAVAHADSFEKETLLKIEKPNMHRSCCEVQRRKSQGYWESSLSFFLLGGSASRFWGIHSIFLTIKNDKTKRNPARATNEF